MIRVFSPHFDDAVLSLGQYLAVEPGVIHTVFGGIPQQFGYVSDYDRSNGYKSSQTAMLTRRDEDKAACKILGAVSRPCGFLDLQYRDGEEPDCDKIIEMICGLLHPDIHLFAPLGLDHPDHRLVSQCVRLACPPEILFYEELPARVLHPEQVVEALDEIDAEGWTIDALPVPLPSGDRRLKEHALRCYRSQFGDDLDPAFLVPERVWRATK